MLKLLTRHHGFSSSWGYIIARQVLGLPGGRWPALASFLHCFLLFVYSSRSLLTLVYVVYPLLGVYFRRRVEFDFGLVFPPARPLYECFFITSGVMMQCAEDGICVHAPYCWRVSMLRNMYNVVAEFLPGWCDKFVSVCGLYSCLCYYYYHYYYYCYCYYYYVLS